MNYTLEAVKTYIAYAALRDNRKGKGKIKEEQISYVLNLINEMKLK